MTKGRRGRPKSKPESEVPAPITPEEMFKQYPETYKGYNILAGKALLLALWDRRTARRLHVLGRVEKVQGLTVWRPIRVKRRNI